MEAAKDMLENDCTRVFKKTIDKRCALLRNKCRKAAALYVNGERICNYAPPHMWIRMAHAQTPPRAFTYATILGDICEEFAVIAPLDALSPLDGRYATDTAPLRPYLTEAALYRARVQVEIEYLIFLARSPRIPFVPTLDAAQQGGLRALYRQFTPDDAAAVAAWDRRVNHDVKAVEYWLRERLEALGLGAWSEALHWALTSEDDNNLA